MLTQLYIDNIAVIERAAIDFEPGFTVLTGETGAGKSIIIDAIYAVLGERTSRELIRTGADQACVSALFTGIAPQTEAVLREFGIPLEEDGSLLIRREIRQHGKSSCKLNNFPATVSMLKAVGATLIDILGQHESYKLLAPETHGDYIDSFAGTKPLLGEYRAAYKALRELRDALEALETDEGQKARRMDILRYQIEELEAAQLRVGEQAELTEKRDEIRNSERILRGVSEAAALLQGDEDTDGAVTAVTVAADALEQAARFAPSLSDLAQRVRDAEYALSDAAADVSDYLDNAQFDLSALDEMESRLEVIYRLSLKYGETEAEMLDFLEKARSELSDIEFSDEKRALRARQAALLQAPRSLRKLLPARQGGARRAQHAGRLFLRGAGPHTADEFRVRPDPVPRFRQCRRRAEADVQNRIGRRAFAHHAVGHRYDRNADFRRDRHRHQRRSRQQSRSEAARCLQKRAGYLRDASGADRRDGGQPPVYRQARGKGEDLYRCACAGSCGACARNRADHRRRRHHAAEAQNG